MPEMRYLWINHRVFLRIIGLADSNTHSNSQGSNVGRASSAVTGNGAAIGGGTHGAGQTTSPGSRATEVQNLQAAEGRGRINSAKPGK